MPLPWLLKLVIQLVQFALSDAPVFCVGSTAASEASIAVSIIPQLKKRTLAFANARTSDLVRLRPFISYESYERCKCVNRI